VRMWDYVGRTLAATERVFEVIDAQREEPDPDTQVRMPDIKGILSVPCLTLGNPATPLR